MGQFNGFKFTSRGLTLHSKVQTGDLLQFTRIAVGDGALGSTDPVALNGLISQKKSLQITKLESLGGGRSVVGTALTNGDVTTGFYLREIGVFAQDPDVGEILYCYGNAGTTADWIPPGAGGGQDLIEQAMNIETITGNAPNVSAVINQSLVFATAAQLGDLSQLQTVAKDSAVAAINELFTSASNGKSRVQGGNLEYWDGANFIPVLRQQGGIAGNGANMNNFQTTGVYRLGENNANGPAGVDINYSQLAVFNGGADTVGQAIFVWGSGDMWIRTGTTSNNWKPWKRATGQTTVSSAAPSGGFDGDVWFQV